MYIEINELNYPAGWYIAEFTQNPHIDQHNAQHCNYPTPGDSGGVDDVDISDEFWTEAKRMYLMRYNQGEVFRMLQGKYGIYINIMKLSPSKINKKVTLYFIIFFVISSDYIL